MQFTSQHIQPIPRTRVDESNGVEFLNSSILDPFCQHYPTRPTNINGIRPIPSLYKNHLVWQNILVAYLK